MGEYDDNDKTIKSSKSKGRESSMDPMLSQTIVRYSNSHLSNVDSEMVGEGESTVIRSPTMRKSMDDDTLNEIEESEDTIVKKAEVVDLQNEETIIRENVPVDLYDFEDTTIGGKTLDIRESNTFAK